MKKLFVIAVLSVCTVLSACKGNGSTSTDTTSTMSDTTTGLNDGTGAPGSGTGAAGAGTVGDSTATPQDTVNGAPQPQRPDTMKH
ncbi:MULTISPECIES: hypothetical protein [unclassified Mucilaginibacter]|uniref:hypothetical protein n=1 Tax=unclassified Mucilaginibacter TaxID=2617802 RepID=UPI00138B7596|nr:MULTISPECIES: hypothetical protein [unclassified Mucilaginibacter]MBB5394756.1 hypothetical protein [Mucilaginibacter sp. AK015]QHS56867.1 hypothetical protein GWR56_15425 [Mucilaginibacter sp. 14171R-50]